LTQEMQQIGDVAAKIVNRWQWYQNALKGEFGPIHESEPQQGYYRVRRKGEPWEPVAIFYPEGSDELVAYRNGREARDINSLWTWACRSPISFEAYEKAMAGDGFDDEPRAAPGIGDNSGEADPFDAIAIELAGEIEMAEGFLKVEVKTQADADKAGIWAKRLTDLAKRADNQRVVEKEPHLAASRAVDDKWRDPIANAKEWATKLKRHVEGFLIAQKRAEEERQRKAAEEATRLRQEAEKAARAARDNQEDQNREKARYEADVALQAARDAEKEAEARKVNAGRTGARVSVRVEKVGVVTDYGKAAAALVAMNHKDLIATIDQLAQRAAKAGMPFDGMEIKEVETVR
jgi:hypothetical protein